MSLLTSKKKKNERVLEDKELEEAEKNKVWLNAWYDPLAGVCVHSACMAFSDINGDGDFKLVVASSGNNPLLRQNSPMSTHKLRVYKGTSAMSENSLLEEPVAVRSFYTDYKSPRRPTLAIASGPHIFLYRNLQPHHKFTLPATYINENERIVWECLKTERYDAKTAFEELMKLRDNSVPLSSRSYEVLSLTDPEEIRDFFNRRKETPLLQQTAITCMAVLAKDKDEPDAIGCLVVGTESKKVFILDPTGCNIIDSVDVPSVPVFMATGGALDIDSRIVVACRDCNIYTIKNRKLSGVVIELDTHACGLIRCDKNIVVATINNNIHCFSPRGKRQYSIYLPSPIKNLELLDMAASRNVRCAIVALENRELRVYNGKNMVHCVTTSDVVTGMRFGTYGSEGNTLALSYRNGGLEFKIVSRKSKLETTGKGGPPPEQEVPLNLPVRTMLYMDQTEREKKYSTEMHRVFQKELCKLRLTTARAFVKILTDGQGPLSYTSGASIRLVASVQGLGPLFKVKLNIQNTGVKTMSNISIIFSYNQEIYTMKQTKILIPVLLPGLETEYFGELSVITHLGENPEQPVADIVKVFVCSESSSIPLITAVVQMPIPDLMLVSQQ